MLQLGFVENRLVLLLLFLSLRFLPSLHLAHCFKCLLLLELHLLADFLLLISAVTEVFLSDDLLGGPWRAGLLCALVIVASFLVLRLRVLHLIGSALAEAHLFLFSAIEIILCGLEVTLLVEERLLDLLIFRFSSSVRCSKGLEGFSAFFTFDKSMSMFAYGSLLRAGGA